MKKFLLVCLFFVVSLSLNAQVKLLTLKELDKRISKGNDTTYVINFWATWCTPCIEELPYFEKLNIEYKNKPLKVILLSFDTKSKLQSRVIPFVKDQKLEAEVYLINEKDQQTYIEKIDKKWSGSLPATLFINNKNKNRLFYSKPFDTYKELTAKLEGLFFNGAK